MKTIRLRDGETAIVGYGSLLWPASLSSFLRRTYGGPFVTCRIAGWRRCWNIAMPNAAFYFEENAERVYPGKIIYLNVCPAMQTMNCTVFVLGATDLEALNRVEWIYEPVRVTTSLRGVRIVGGEALLYVGRSEHLVEHVVSRREGAIRASYIRTLETALNHADPAIRMEYEETTDPVPAHLVVEDVFDQGRPNPWSRAGLAYRPDDQVP